MLNAFFDVSQQVVVLFLLIGLGVVLTKLNLLKESGVKVMTDVVLFAVTPCVIVDAFQRPFDEKMLTGLLISLLAAALVMGFSVLLAELLYRKKQLDKAVVLKFAVVFSNAGFMALPLQKAVLGSDGVFFGAAFVAVFNIFMWSWGIITMSGKKEPKAIFKALINPGIIGTLIGVILFVFRITLPEILSLPVGYLAALNTPVPMLIIGFHLAGANLLRVLKEKDSYLALALRLIFLPLLTLFVLKLCGADKTVTTAMVIATSAPVAAFTTMMSSKFNHDTELSAGIVSLSTLLSLVTMPLIIGLAQYLG